MRDRIILGKKMGKIRKVIGEMKILILMVVVQFAYAGVSISYKLVANARMSLSIFMAYRFLFASAFIIPLAFFLERKSKPKITRGILFQAFLCGLFGNRALSSHHREENGENVEIGFDFYTIEEKLEIRASLQQNLFVKAVALASATYATAMYNLIPGATFVLAVCVGLEKLNIRTWEGKAKVVGTILGMGGAMILTFYNTTEIHLWSTHLNLTRHVAPHPTPANQMFGCALAFGTCLSFSLWLTLQTWFSEKFPHYYTSAALMSVMATIQSVVFALCIERDWNQWKLGLDVKLYGALYSGIVASGLSWALISWCVRIKGPLYASIFNPLFLVLTAIGGSLVLDEVLHSGSIIGSVLIVIGLYMVLWGKGKELKENADHKLAPKDQSSLDGDSSLNAVITTNHHEDAKTIQHTEEKEVIQAN